MSLRFQIYKVFIERLFYLNKIKLQFRVHPVCALLGATPGG